MARNASTRAGDFTGRQKEELTAKHAAEQAAAAKNLATITAAAAEEAKTEPIEIKTLEEIEAEKPVDDAPTDVAIKVAKAEPKKRFRVNEPIEKMTFGAGNTYDFELGQEYTGPKSLYDHLDSKGLIYH